MPKPGTTSTTRVPLGVDPLWAMAAAQTPSRPQPAPRITARSDPHQEELENAERERLRVWRRQVQEHYDNDRYEQTMKLMDGYALSPQDTFALWFRGPCDATLDTDPDTCGLEGQPEEPDPAFSAAMAAVTPTKKTERVVVLSKAAPSVQQQLANRIRAINAAAAAQAAAAHAAGNTVIENPDGTMSIWQSGRETVLID